MDFQTIKARDDQYVMHTYNRFPVDIDHGKNATLWSAEGKEYIDFTSGIGVNSVGVANPKWVDAVAVQAAKLGHMSNLFYTQPCGALAERLCRRAGMSAALYTALPATSTLAPAAMAMGAVSGSMPPSTSSAQAGFRASI